MSVIMLENMEQQEAAHVLSCLINEARDGRKRGLRKFIRSLWDGESWESIIKRADTEGSVWYVWWMDGVNAFIKSQEGVDQ